MRRYNILKITLLLLIASPMLIGQINDGQKYKLLLKGEIFADTIVSRFPVSAPAALVENCSLVSTPLGNQKYKITITPLNATVTNAKASVQYTDNFKPRWITWNLTYLDSKISTSDDYVFYSDDSQLVVAPLSNDVSTAGNLSIVGLGRIDVGTAFLANDTVYYTPDLANERGYVLYAVKDTFGTTANGVMHFIKEENLIGSDTLRFALLNTRDIIIYTPSIDFVLSSNPDLGVLTNIQPKVYQYTPNKASSGMDTIVFADNASNSRVFIFKILNQVQNTSSVRDDRVFTPKNTSVTFDVFANDLSSNFPIINFSNGLINNTLGIFTYAPPNGFSGVKNFFYTVNYGHYQATAKISIVVGNYQPQINQIYDFSTLKNQALVLNYDVPVDGYTFNVLNQPQYGSVEIFENSTVAEGCDSITSKLTIIYTPDNNYFGADSFDLEYCIINNLCIVYKSNINIYDATPDTLCHCKGRDCVWAGDMNGDGRVSVSDILALGRFAGLSGSSRNDITYPFRAGQTSSDWMYDQPNGLNIKHIDSNGDGVISEADTLAISDYYADVHTFVPQEILAIKDYPFTLIPNATQLDSGDLLILDVVIGEENNPVIDIFGLAFALNVAPEMIDSASLVVDFDRNSWFTANSSSLQMYRQPKEGAIHTALTKVASIVEDELEGFKPIGTSGNGSIGKILFIVEDELEGFKTKENFITRRISTSGIEMEDAVGEKFLLPETYVDIRINLDKSEPVPTSDKLILYPNPATENILLHFNGRNEIKGYKVYDQMGSLIAVNSEVNAQSANINTSAYASGIYVVQLVTTQGTITKKVIILDKK